SDVNEMLSILEATGYKELMLWDIKGKSKLVYVDSLIAHSHKAIKTLTSYKGSASYGVQSLENEIIASFKIEQIDTSRESVRKILAGQAPVTKGEYRIWGMKKGFEFMADPANKISANSVRQLYEIAVNPYHEFEENKLETGQMYRNDTVEVFDHAKQVSLHRGLDADKIPAYMDALFKFIDSKDDIDDLSKAAIIHFYIAYVHPYFDGNGRMARMIHLWFLLQKGYSSTLFMPFSALIEGSRKAYYDVFKIIENNAEISGVIDVTPFVQYMQTQVYATIGEATFESNVLNQFKQLINDGEITEKEKQLFHFILLHYGENEFSTKQLEKDFGNCAYATIRAFVLKLKAKNILDVNAYKNRNKYFLKAPDEVVIKENQI
ncbi:MAG: Fic family protein, partial [Firmicutes bacterium]|nr:Fic family protein [Bacillota bacterium]